MLPGPLRLAVIRVDGSARGSGLLEAAGAVAVLDAQHSGVLAVTTADENRGLILLGWWDVGKEGV